jgi:UDP-glucose 4-epimerase
MSNSQQTWLITGGAGYIGSHIVDEFIKHGKKVVVYDSLVKGLESRIEYLRLKHIADIPLIIADIRDGPSFEKTIKEYKVYGIIHTAALKAVGESIQKPDEYFEVNLKATIDLLRIVSKNSIRNFIFSSTAAVYGKPASGDPCIESGPKSPISPYGDSKLQAEAYVENFLKTPGNLGTSLRFFNVVGTAAFPELLDNSTENLVPIVINKILAGQPPEIFGTTYATPDGTCVRDYVDVRDVARAHLVAANARAMLPPAINIGTGKCTSVRDVIQLVLSSRKVSNTQIVELECREGDPAFLCANVDLAHSTLGFKSRFTLEESIRSLF